MWSKRDESFRIEQYVGRSKSGYFKKIIVIVLASFIQVCHNVQTQLWFYMFPCFVRTFACLWLFKWRNSRMNGWMIIWLLASSFFFCLRFIRVFVVIYLFICLLLYFCNWLYLNLFISESVLFIIKCLCFNFNRDCFLNKTILKKVKLVNNVIHIFPFKDINILPKEHIPKCLTKAIHCCTFVIYIYSRRRGFSNLT